MFGPGGAWTPGGVVLGTTTYLTNPGRLPTSWSPKRPTTSTAVVAPAVRWAAPLPNGSSRLGLLFGHRLLLLRMGAQGAASASGTGALVVDLDLPLFGKEIRIEGTPIGRIGGRLVLLQGGRLVLWDVDRGTQGSFDLALVGGAFKQYQVHAAHEGAFVYLSGPGGILCVNLMTLRQVWHAPWPESVRQLRNDEPTWVQYLLHGMIEFRQGSPLSPLLKPCGMVDETTLYTVSDPFRVVALENIPADAAPPRKEDARER
jgi:hypothetical protein